MFAGRRSSGTSGRRWAVGDVSVRDIKLRQRHTSVDCRTAQHSRLRSLVLVDPVTTINQMMCRYLPALPLACSLPICVWLMHVLSIFWRHICFTEAAMRHLVTVMFLITHRHSTPDQQSLQPCNVSALVLTVHHQIQTNAPLISHNELSSK